MRGYTRASVKKRDSGRAADSYLAKIPPSDNSVCTGCHAIYHNKHWTLDEILYKSLVKGSASGTLCPACQKIKDHFASGILLIRGDYFKRHEDEILNLIRNEEKRARGFNPLERIVSVRKVKGEVEIETTNEKLAQRLGRRLHRAYQGQVRYKWSGNDKFIRVEWERYLSEKPSP